MEAAPACAVSPPPVRSAGHAPKNKITWSTNAKECSTTWVVAQSDLPSVFFILAPPVFSVFVVNMGIYIHWNCRGLLANLVDV